MENIKQFYSNYYLDRIQKIKPLNKFCNSLLDKKSKNLITLKEDLKKLINSTFMPDLINHELRKMNNETLYATMPGSFDFFTVFDSLLYTLTISSAKIEMIKNQLIYDPYASDRFIIPLNNDGFYYDLLEQEKPYPVDIIDKTKKINYIKKNELLAKGKILFLKKHRDIFSFSKKNNETIMFMSFSLKKEDPFVWEYNAQNLLPTKIEARNSQLSSRLEQMLKLVGELNSKVSIPYLFKLLEYPDFNVRWGSAKAIMDINFEDGVKALSILKNDKHPEIIKAVNEAFSQLSILKLI